MASSVVKGKSRTCILRMPIPAIRQARLYHSSPMIHLMTDEPAGGASPVPKFKLGAVIATPGVMAKLTTDDIENALRRHHCGDWGDLGEEDRQENERALRDGHRLFSVYRTEAGVRFYVITEYDRLLTTVLLPEEY